MRAVSNFQEWLNLSCHATDRILETEDGPRLGWREKKVECERDTWWIEITWTWGVPDFGFMGRGMQCRDRSVGTLHWIECEWTYNFIIFPWRSISTSEIKGGPWKIAVLGWGLHVRQCLDLGAEQVGRPSVFETQPQFLTENFSLSFKNFAVKRGSLWFESPWNLA